MTPQASHATARRALALGPRRRARPADSGTGSNLLAWHASLASPAVTRQTSGRPEPVPAVRSHRKRPAHARAAKAEVRLVDASLKGSGRPPHPVARPLQCRSPAGRPGRRPRRPDGGGSGARAREARRAGPTALTPVAKRLL